MKSITDFLDLIGDITIGVMHEVSYFIESNLRYIPIMIDISLPYVMYAVGQEVFQRRGEIRVGGELLIPLFMGILSLYLTRIANGIGKGNGVPIPKRRFTMVDEDGEVSIENRRLQELLLYVADLEDYIERKRLL